MGEIGISRREFLYEISFFEARRILKGYENRHRVLQELQRLTAFYSLFAMRDNRSGIQPKDLYLFPWERGTADKMPISDDEIAEELAILTELNKKDAQQ